MVLKDNSPLTHSNFASLPQLIREYKQNLQPRFKEFSWFSPVQESTILFQLESFFMREMKPFHRSSLKGHFTASCLLINPETGKMVLTHHRKLGLWLQLGGHCDGLQNLAEVAMKEAEEESGLKKLSFSPLSKIKNHFIPLDFDIHEIPANKNDPEHLHLDVRFLIETSETELKISDESLDLKWFTPDEALEITDEESLHRLILKYKVILNS